VYYFDCLNIFFYYIIYGKSARMIAYFDELPSPPTQIVTIFQTLESIIFYYYSMYNTLSLIMGFCLTSLTYIRSFLFFSVHIFSLWLWQEPTL
jgi:hypothetical protein